MVKSQIPFYSLDAPLHLNLIVFHVVFLLFVVIRSLPLFFSVRFSCYNVPHSVHSDHPSIFDGAPFFIVVRKNNNTLYIF